ncbi:MAG: family 20 glycosylhydrolase [Kangiellaceae bacterium]|nr:family 20 glycosylhydrolase [Kangiellaceae bacterium]
MLDKILKIFAVSLLSLFIMRAQCMDDANITVENSNNNLLGFHFVFRNIVLEDAMKISSMAKQNGYTHIVTLVTDGVELNNAPWKLSKKYVNRSEFKEWISYTKSLGLEIIPELKLLTHQEKFLQDYHPQFLYNDVTYNPNSEVYSEIVFPLINELIELLEPKALHIGHDEAAGHSKYSKNKWLGDDQKIIPADLFVQDVIRLHDYLKSKNIKTWIWGDMLISQKEFPKMLKKHLHGNLFGYGKPLRDQLPRDLVVCDWHYWDEQIDFPTVKTLKSEGFNVIGTTWESEDTTNNFTDYALKNGALGMISSSWFYIQNGDWDTVEKIMKESSAIYYEKRK